MQYRLVLGMVALFGLGEAHAACSCMCVSDASTTSLRNVCTSAAEAVSAYATKCTTAPDQTGCALPHSSPQSVPVAAPVDGVACHSGLRYDPYRRAYVATNLCEDTTVH